MNRASMFQQSKRPYSKFILILAIALGLFAVSCGNEETNGSPTDQKIAEDKANDRENYDPVNDVEGRNYNARQRLADSPATIIWCTAIPTNPNYKAFTVPIVGKLTSGNKRPYSTQRSLAGGSDGTINEDFYTTEIPGPDGFYGSSGEYRYGFDPNGNYQDFYGIETYCTSAPTLTQRNTTEMSVTVTGDALTPAIQKAEEALKACRAVNPDPSEPCPEATKALGYQG